MNRAKWQPALVSNDFCISTWAVFCWSSVGWSQLWSLQSCPTSLAVQASLCSTYGPCFLQS